MSVTPAERGEGGKIKSLRSSWLYCKSKASLGHMRSCPKTTKGQLERYFIPEALV